MRKAKYYTKKQTVGYNELLTIQYNFLSLA